MHKLTKEGDIIEEMHMYAAEEIGLRNQEAMLSLGRPLVPISPQPFEQKPQVNILPEDLPLPWRGRPIPPELQERLASLNTISEPSGSADALLSIFAVFARTMLNSFQRAEGLILLSGSARESFYEIWSITVPSIASIVVSLAVVLWICLKVLRSKWPKQLLLVIGAYIVGFLIFQWFLVGLGFEAFD